MTCGAYTATAAAANTPVTLLRHDQTCSAGAGACAARKTHLVAGHIILQAHTAYSAAAVFAPVLLQHAQGRLESAHRRGYCRRCCQHWRAAAPPERPHSYCPGRVLSCKNAQVYSLQFPRLLQVVPARRRVARGSSAERSKECSMVCTSSPAASAIASGGPHGKLQKAGCLAFCCGAMQDLTKAERSCCCISLLQQLHVYLVS